MIVSWNWLKQYVALDMSADELSLRLMMAGLNHESTTAVDGDLAIDLEVTSNRPDCLGHIGIAREVGALWNLPISIPAAAPRETGPAAATLTHLSVEAPDLCPQYTARVIQGVKVGPSPKWLSDRLRTLGQDSINNVVDVTNYVLFECGQPLHAFDFDQLEGRRIVVRAAKAGETLEAINHKTYPLEAGMCVVADAVKPVALAGVMGGAGTEVLPHTKNVLIESASFAPLSVRTTSHRLKLRSDASYRFERGVDPDGVDWASRRCCELILELAGGTLASGVVAVEVPRSKAAPVALRFSQLQRVLGIVIPPETVRRILKSLGAEELSATPEGIEVQPPHWRRDLTREIDLIEEAARIHGYEAIPENVPVPLTAASRSVKDRVVDKVRRTLTALGYDECVTLSCVDPETSAAFSPWTAAEPLRAEQPVLRRADVLRRSLVPSLLAARRTNESLGNEWIELFEVAKAYLPAGEKLPQEPVLVGLSSGRDFFAVKGAVEAILANLNPAIPLEVKDATLPLLHAEKAVELHVGGKLLGFLGEVSKEGLALFDLRKPATVAEIQLDRLLEVANLIPRYQPISDLPSSSRDLNFLLAETVRWNDLEALVRRQAGGCLESLQYRETYRHKSLGDRKSVLMTLVFRGKQGTLTHAEIDGACQAVAGAVKDQFGGELRTG